VASVAPPGSRNQGTNRPDAELDAKATGIIVKPMNNWIPGIILTAVFITLCVAFVRINAMGHED
jgi:hypothetical protein